MKRFKDHSKTNSKFCWKSDDLEHHGVSVKEDVQNFKPPASTNNIDQFHKHGDSLSEVTKKHMRLYKSSSYHLNLRLRKNLPVHAHHYDTALHSKDMVEHLDKATSFPLTHHLTVYRGSEGRHGSHHDKFKTVGHEFTDHGFTSTTLNPKTAQHFSETKKHLFAIHLKPGDKAHHFDMHAGPNDHESEVVLHRGTRFRVSGHSEHPDGTHYTHLEVVGQKPRKFKYS